jgi:DNA-binding HxlR family transcriptional regulator
MSEELNESCKKSLLAIRDTLYVFGGKWKIPIIGALLYFRELRFADLAKKLPEISPRMLSKELKELEMNKLVERVVLDTKPVTVMYKITAYGESCNDMLKEMEKWGMNHRRIIIDN